MILNFKIIYFLLLSQVTRLALTARTIDSIKFDGKNIKLNAIYFDFAKHNIYFLKIIELLHEKNFGFNIKRAF